MEKFVIVDDEQMKWFIQTQPYIVEFDRLELSYEEELKDMTSLANCTSFWKILLKFV